MFVGAEAMAISMFEGMLWQPRRALPFLIFGGVFERFPELKIVFTETLGVWWTSYARDLDSMVDRYSAGSELRQQMPGRPSDYLRQNVYIGGAVLSPLAAAEAGAHNLLEN